MCPCNSAESRWHNRDIVPCSRLASRGGISCFSEHSRIDGFIFCRGRGGHAYVLACKELSQEYALVCV